METKISLLTTETLTYHLENCNHIGYERLLINELLGLCKAGDEASIHWFIQFGESIRTIIFNVHAYRMGLKFGFDSIEFDEYGWFKRPTFLDLEELRFGLPDKSRYGNYSTITLGHGFNQVWSYGMSACYGTSGSSSGISVYDQPFGSREEALKNATDKLKTMMLAKVGDEDTTNYNQKIISATLKDIEKLEVGRVHLSLF